MYQILHSIIPSTFIQFNYLKIGSLILICVITSSNAFANPIAQGRYELAEVYNDASSPSFAVLLSKENNSKVVMYEGDMFAGCTLDYLQFSEASFNCDNEIYTLVASASTNSWNNNLDGQSYTGAKIIGKRLKYEYFDNPENFITDFELVPKVKAGRVEGYRVTKVRNKVAADELNLQENDLIVSINGVYASDPVQFSDAVEGFAVANTIEMEIVRNDAEVINDAYQLEQEINVQSSVETVEVVNEQGDVPDTYQPEQVATVEDTIEVPTTLVGGAPLQITAQPAVIDILPTQAKVQWGLNEVGTGQVHYGTASTLGQFNTKETSFNYSSHTQPLKNLQPGTTYYYKVVSENQAGQVVESGVKVFNTPSDGDATVNVANEEEVVYNTYLLEQDTVASCY
jgi:hypothetical protein